MDDEQKELTTTISYCPDLDVYHYTRSDDSEYFFTTSQLLLGIEAYGKVGDARQAEFMALLAAQARAHPHELVVFDSEGTMSLKRVEPVSLEDVPVSGG